MKMSLRLHPNHGLNPTIPLCFLCGKEKNEVVLLGSSYKKEAPKNMLLIGARYDKGIEF